jgi:hypothetical protein
MGDAIGQLLPLAVGAALSPMPIVAMVLVLVTPRARTNGPAFLLGWVLGIALVGGVLLAVAGPTDPSDQGEPATWVGWLQLVLGLLLVGAATKMWRGRPQEADPVERPGWMEAIATFTPLKAAGIGAFVGVVNPKNLLLVVGGAAAVAQTGIPGSEQAVAWAVFTVVASIGVGLPLGIYLALGPRAADVLDRLEAWLVRESPVIMAVLCLILGVKLAGDALSTLTT